MKPFLSIVVPVYNVEAYIEKCLRSVYNQDLSPVQFEVIVVNDGTKDKSLEICEVLQKEFTDLKIISQENKGLSGARNTGLSHAKGDYVWFVDSDDWLPANCLKQIVDTLKIKSPDLLWLGHSVVHNGEIIRTYIPAPIDEPVAGDEFFAHHLQGLYYIWKFIYSREFLSNNNLFFYEGLLYEDLEFTPRALEVAQRCITLTDSFYFYLMREGSIVNKVKAKNVENRFFILENHYKRYKETTSSNLYRNALLYTCIESFAGTIKMAARSGIKLSHSSRSLWKLLKTAEKKSEINYPYDKLLAINLPLYHRVYGVLARTYKLLFK
ncbi:glycosyltransferase family 2 protein [Flagellimonas aequoris]|uniref:Glycosyltransferase n=1 Tax=Flagellimonas aequoris TaxID=2306997 RepID=A0A418NDH7_9FLAO|nr:glycosyltransferase [Allomuricauda aequoris]RIV74386.1 glycosyltransferase [Allomuricauda aequoris]TXK08508.1 glycosyltransferase [Allomuricauda aequoris]